VHHITQTNSQLTEHSQVVCVVAAAVVLYHTVFDVCFPSPAGLVARADGDTAVDHVQYCTVHVKLEGINGASHEAQAPSQEGLLFCTFYF
jgi:hypothetical protein